MMPRYKSLFATKGQFESRIALPVAALRRVQQDDRGIFLASEIRPGQTTTETVPNDG
jgi:hypothetical protein